jgi:site-specific DNA-methyltransferase (adenine-specific)
MMATPYYDQDGIVIYHGDYADVVASIGRVDHVITDPPYNTRAANIDLANRAPMRRDFGDWDAAWSPAPFLERVGAMVRPGGTLIAFTSDLLLSDFRESARWKARGTIVWIKSNPAPHPRPQYVQATELIVWLTKTGAAAVWNGSGYTPNTLYYNACAGAERTEHPNQKPEALLIELITRHTNPGDLIFDPFMGSGTTLAAAKRIGRRAIGIDINERYCEIAATRLQQRALALEFY